MKIVRPWAGEGDYTEIILDPVPAAELLARCDLQNEADRITATARYLRARYAALVSPSPWEHVLRHAGGRWY